MEFPIKYKNTLIYQLGIGLTVAFAALYFTVKDISLTELFESFKRVDFYYIIMVVAILGLNYLCRVYRWQSILEPTKKIGVLGLFPPVMIGYMGNLIPGGAGEILRPYLMAKKFNLTFSVALASLAVERLFDLVILMLITGWVFWAQAGLFHPDLEISGISVRSLAIKFGQISLGLTLGLVVFIYFLVWQKEKLLRFVKWTTTRLPENWRKKVEFLINEFSLGCSVVKNFWVMSRIAIFSALIWITGIFAWYPLYLAYELENITITSLLVLNVMVTILITVVPTPAFLGSYNAGVLIALHEIMNEPEIKAISFGMISWGLFVATILAGGFYFILTEHFSFKTLAQIKKEGITALSKEQQENSE